MRAEISHAHIILPVSGGGTALRYAGAARSHDPGDAIDMAER